jgi:hypothetical protein
MYEEITQTLLNKNHNSQETSVTEMERKIQASVLIDPADFIKTLWIYGCPATATYFSYERSYFRVNLEYKVLRKYVHINLNFARLCSTPCLNMSINDFRSAI